MSNPRIGRNATTLGINPTLTKQTPHSKLTFSTLLKGGAEVLLAGAKIATSAISTPLLSAAISAPIQTMADTGWLPASDNNGFSPALNTVQPTPVVASGGTAVNPAGAPASQSGNSEDLKLLALQDEIQRHNRQVSLISNVMKARHETTKSTISNIRA